MSTRPVVFGIIGIKGWLQSAIKVAPGILRLFVLLLCESHHANLSPHELRWSSSSVAVKFKFYLSNSSILSNKHVEPASLLCAALAIRGDGRGARRRQSQRKQHAS